MTGVDPDGTIRVEVLGPLRLVVDGQEVSVPGSKRRSVLALLALADDRPMSIDSLVGALWPDGAVRSERQALQSHVSRLRRQLGPAAHRLRSTPGGYLLVLDGQLDATEARELWTRARTIRDPTTALELLRRAHALWRGPELDELADISEIERAATRLRALWRDVTLELTVRSVDAGRARDAVQIARELLADDPRCEASAVALVRALAADGHAAEALRVARDFRRRLIEESGLDPSPDLAELEHVVASRTPAEASTKAVPPSPPHPHRAATRLIGRADEVEAVTDLLSHERLVTLVGPGGVGKTRLAREIAERTGDAVVVPLSTVSDPSDIPHVLATAVGLSITRGDVLNASADLLADRPGLLIVDNCEHLLDGARDLVHLLLSRCPNIGVLATGRAPLGSSAETIVRLWPLALPGSGADDATSASVALFLERAARARPDRQATDDELAVVEQIVDRLDGLPLAIELAAGRLSTLSIADLHDRLDRSLDLLAASESGAHPRHRTLRATLEWSDELLDDDAQRLFRGLAVFPDGVDLATAEWIADDLGLAGDPVTVLARLVDASIVQVDESRRPRYRMLETTRLFAQDRLTMTGEATDTARRLVRWGVRLTRWVDAAMRTTDEPRADALVRREMPNLRAAWRTARRLGVDDADARDAAVSMVGSLFDVVAYRDMIEVRTWAHELAADATTRGCSRAAAAFGAAAEAAYHDGDLERAVESARVGLSLAADPDGGAECRLAFASAALARGDLGAVGLHTRATVARRHDELGGVEALATLYSGDATLAKTQVERAYADSRSPTLLAWRDYILGEIAGRTGAADVAEDHYLRAIVGAERSGATFVVGVATVGLLTIRTHAGRLSDALEGYRDLIASFRNTGNWTHLWVTLRNLTNLLDALGCHDDAELILAACDTADGRVLDDAIRLVDRLLAAERPS